MRHFLIVALFFLAACICRSQDTIQTSQSKIRIYLDCDECDFTFFRRNLTMVDFVREPQLAAIHILVTEQETAADGTEFGINFIGSGRFAGMQYRLKTISPQSDTEVLKRERLLKIINIGLLPYLSFAVDIDKVRIEVDDQPQKPEPSTDKWKFWVFSVESGLEFEAEESQKEYVLNTAVRGDHITEKVKFRTEFSHQMNREIYKDDEETIENRQEEMELSSGLVYSLGPRWSLGLFSDLSSSTYMNIGLASRIGPGIEYNIFPWDKSDRKVFTLAYHLRSDYSKYNEPTIFGHTEEWRASQAMRLSLFLRQPWGEVENTIEASSFLHDFSKNRLSLESDISVKLFKGFSVFMELEAELVHDQLYLPAGEASREEILLEQRKLATAFEVSGDIGVRFTFGSLFNNIVNQRLDSY